MNRVEHIGEIDTDAVLGSLAPFAHDELARRHLPDFMQLLISDYVTARHSSLLCDYLEKLERREILKLIVLEPPRYGKSLHVAQGFPAWYLGRHPGHDVILASYGGELAERNSRHVQSLMRNPRYPFPVGVSRTSSAVHRWYTTGGGAVIAAGRQRVEYPELLDAVRTKVKEFRPGAVYVEDAGSGQSLIQTLKRERNMPIIKYLPKWHKDVRVANASRFFHAGRVILPAQAPWLADWIEEHVKFPLTRFDDQVDTTSMALEKLDVSYWPRIRVAVAP